MESRTNQNEGVSDDCHHYGNDQQDRRGSAGKTNVASLPRWILQAASLTTYSQSGLIVERFSKLSISLKKKNKSLWSCCAKSAAEDAKSGGAMRHTIDGVQHCCSSGLVSPESDLKRFRMSFLGIAKKQDKGKKKTQHQQQRRTVTLILYRLTCYAHHISATVASALCAT